MPQDPTPQRVAYLPPRAGKARKLILRSQLGLPWMLAAILFGLVILVAGTLFLVKGGRPGAPWQRVAPVTRFADGAVSQAPLRASCPVVGTPTGFARPCVQQAWDQSGEPLGSHGLRTPPPRLRAVPATVAKGDLYVNPSAA